MHLFSAFFPPHTRYEYQYWGNSEQNRHAASLHKYDTPVQKTEYNGQINM